MSTRASRPPSVTVSNKYCWRAKMLTKKTLTLAAMLTATLTLAGCFTAPGSADVYSVGQAQREQDGSHGHGSKACVRCASSRTAAAARSARSAAAHSARSRAARSAAARLDPDGDRRRPGPARWRATRSEKTSVPRTASKSPFASTTATCARSRKQPAAKSSAQASAYDCCRAAASRASRTNEHPQHAAQAAVERMCEVAHAFFFVHARRITSMPGRVRAKKIPPSRPDGGTIE